MLLMEHFIPNTGYQFIANSASYSYLNAAGFSEFFSVPVISRIESIGNGQAGEGWGRPWGWSRLGICTKF